MSLCIRTKVNLLLIQTETKDYAISSFTVFASSLVHFYKVICYIKMDKISWIYGIGSACSKSIIILFLYTHYIKMSRTTWTYSTACVILYTYSLTLLFQIHDKRSLLELSNLASKAYLHAEFQQGFTDSQTMTTSAVVL